MHLISEIIPTRMEVKWYISDDNLVIIEYNKQFTKIELMLSNLLRSPKKVKRTLDKMNSGLWLLIDGKNDLATITHKMALLYKEEILPAEERIKASIIQMIELGLVNIKKE